MYFVLLSLLSQSACLFSLCYSGHEYNYLYWYIPNWVASSLILLPNIYKKYKKDGECTARPFLGVICFLALLGNLVVTVLFQHLRWVGIVPAVVTVCLVISYELCSFKNKTC